MALYYIYKALGLLHVATPSPWSYTSAKTRKDYIMVELFIPIDNNSVSDHLFTDACNWFSADSFTVKI